MKCCEDDFEAIILFVDIALEEHRHLATTTCKATSREFVTAHSNVCT